MRDGPTGHRRFILFTLLWLASDIAAANPRVLKDPVPVIGVAEISDLGKAWLSCCQHEVRLLDHVPAERALMAVRVGNDPNQEAGGPLAELLRLQADFHTRLTTETLRYLRLLQGAFAPATPGTVMMPDTTAELHASGAPGSVVQLRLEVENRQRAHCVVTPVLAPLVDASGATWFPAAEALPPSALLAPGGVATLLISVPLPSDLPAGTYRGVLVLQGFRNGGAPVVVTATAPTNGAGGQRRAAVRRAPAAKRRGRASRS